MSQQRNPDHCMTPLAFVVEMVFIDGLTLAVTVCECCEHEPYPFMESEWLMITL